MASKSPSVFRTLMPPTFLLFLLRLLCWSRSWMSSLPYLYCWWSRRPCQVLFPLSQRNCFQPKLLYLWLVVQLWLCRGRRPLQPQWRHCRWTWCFGWWKRWSSKLLWSPRRSTPRFLRLRRRGRCRLLLWRLRCWGHRGSFGLQLRSSRRRRRCFSWRCFAHRSAFEHLRSWRIPWSPPPIPRPWRPFPQWPTKQWPKKQPTRRSAPRT